jgi:pilus assembly protein TadC
MVAPLAVLAGAVAGLGVAIAVAAVLPARPDLRSALAQLSAVPAPAPQVSLSETGHRLSGWEQAAGGWLARRLLRPGGGLPVPTADLDILGRRVESFLAQKLAMALLGLALPAALFTLLALLGLQLPISLPVVVGLIVAALLFFAPDLVVRAAAKEARDEFRHAVAAYLNLVALERAADGGPTESLERAATVAHGWAFHRIADTLVHARVAGITPWTALSELAERLGIGELADLADIVALAGGEGAAIYDTLLGKATSMRRTATSADEARANSRSEQMTLPTVLLFLGFLILLVFPALARAFTAT